MASLSNTIFNRCLYVTTRLPEAAEEHGTAFSDGLLLETATGRFVINEDARTVWASVDGTRTVEEIVAHIALEIGAEGDVTVTSVADFCANLQDRGLIEAVPSPSDASA